MSRAQGRVTLNTVERDGGQENQSGHTEGERANRPVGQPTGAAGEAARAARLARLQMEDLGADRAEAIMTRDRGRDFQRVEVDRVEANRLSNRPGTAEWEEARRNASSLGAWKSLLVIEDTDKKDLADGQGHRITRQRAQDAQAAAAPTATRVYPGRGGHAHGGARGGGVIGTRGRGGSLPASHHQTAKPAPAIPAGENRGRGTSIQDPLPSKSSRTARKRRQRERKRLSSTSAGPSEPRGAPKAVTGVTPSSQPKEKRTKEPAASVAGPTHRAPSRPYVLADRDQFMAGYLAAVAADNASRHQTVGSSPSVVPVRTQALAPLQPRISPARPPLGSRSSPSSHPPPPPRSRLPVESPAQKASNTEASKRILGDRSPKHPKSSKTTGRPLVDVPEHKLEGPLIDVPEYKFEGPLIDVPEYKLEGPLVDIIANGKPVTDLLDNFDNFGTVAYSQGKPVIPVTNEQFSATADDNISNLENTIAELRALARALPDPSVVLESIAFLQTQLDQAFTEAVLGTGSVASEQHSGGLSAVQEVSEDEPLNDDEKSNGDSASSTDDAHSGDEDHSTDEARGADETHSGDEDHSADEAYGADEAHGGDEDHSTDEAYGADEAHSIDEAHSAGRPHSIDEPLDNKRSANEDEPLSEYGTTRVAPSPGVELSVGDDGDDPVHHASWSHSQVRSGTGSHAQVRQHRPIGDQHEALGETSLASTISSVQATQSTTIHPDGSETVVALRTQEHSLVIDTSESEELSQSLRNLHLSSPPDRLHEDSVTSPNQIQTRSHHSDHRDIGSSDLPETDTAGVPASSTDFEHSYPLQETVADRPTPTAITSPLLTTSTHEPHVLITPREGPPISTTSSEGSPSLAHGYRGATDLRIISAIEQPTSSNAPEAATPVAGAQIIRPRFGETLPSSRRSSNAPEAAIPAAGAHIIDFGFSQTLHSSRHSSNAPEAAIPAAGAHISGLGFSETLHSSRHSSNAPEAAIPAAGAHIIGLGFGDSPHSSRRSSNAPEAATPVAGAHIPGPGFGESLRRSRHSSLSTHGQPSSNYRDSSSTSSARAVLSGGVLTSRWSTLNRAVPVKQETKTGPRKPANTTQNWSRRSGVHQLPAWFQESALPQSADPGAAARAQLRERENLAPSRPHSKRDELPEAKRNIEKQAR